MIGVVDMNLLTLENKMDYKTLLIGMAAGYFFRDQIATMFGQYKKAVGMGAIDMNGIHMGAIDMNGLAMRQNPVHMGAIDMNGLAMQRNPHCM